MGNTNEGSQQGKEPGNEPSGASGSSENVASTTNEGSSQVSSGVVDMVGEVDGSISSGSAENVVDQLDGELESTVESDLRTDENPDYLNDDGYNPVDVTYRRNNADGRTDDDRGKVGVGISDSGNNVRDSNPERHLTSSKTLSIGDEKDVGERLELERTVGHQDSDSAFQNSETWRDSTASTMTDASEMYQTAGEDSDNANEVGCDKEGYDYDDDNDDLRKTLRASQIRENIADATSIGYISLTGEDRLRETWEKDPNVNPGYLVDESDKFTYIKGFPMKPVSSTTDEEDDVETEKPRDTTSPHRSTEVSVDSDRVGEVLNAYGEDTDNQRVVGDEKSGIDDVDGEVVNVVKGFDITRYQIDPEKSAATKDLMDFEGNADASENDDDIVTLRTSSVSLQLQSPAPSGSIPKDDKTMDTEEDAATGHAEQYKDDEELPADNDTRQYSEPETDETDSEAEETSVTGLYQITDDDADYDPIDVRGDVDTDDDDDDDDVLSSPHVNEHDITPSSHFSSSVRVVLASNTEGSDFPSGRLEISERDEGQMEGSDIAKDERVFPKDETTDNADRLSSGESRSLDFDHSSGPAYLSKQKEIDAVRSQATSLSEDRGTVSSEEDVPSSATAYSQEHERNGSTLPADDGFRDVSPSAHEASPESKSDEIFISITREQGPRTKTTNDEDLSAERTNFESDVDSDTGRRIRILSVDVKMEEKAEEEEVGHVSDRRSIGLISMTTIDDEDDEAETIGGTVPVVELQSWSGGEEEPEPDYSLSSDDDDARPELKDLIDLSLKSGSSEEHQVTDIGYDAPLPTVTEYKNSVKETDLQQATFSLSSASEQRPDSDSEIIDSRSDDFESWEDDPGADVPLGKFQRMSSIRPSRRGRIRSRRSVAVPPSFSEHPEEEGDFQADDTPGAESVFLPHSAETLTIPHPSRYDRGPLSVPASGKELERDLWAKTTSRDSTRSMTVGRHDGNQSQKRGFLERRNATRTSKPDVPSDEKEWTKYDVVLRKNEGGFGITLSDFCPVVVHRVQEDGVAAKHGIREGDRIHKVNGSLVSSCSHEEVINLIKSSGKDVFLVLQRPSSETRDQPLAPATPFITDNTRLSRLPSKISSSSTSTKSFGGISSITGRMSSPPEVHDTSYDVVPKPFTDLNLLKQKPAHLAVFLNYLLAEGKPNAMLFTLIADCYQNSFKESNNSARRWAYEIYSTFLMPSAPLKLAVDDAIGRSVEKMLQGGSTNGLLALFIPIANLVRNEVVNQLKQFVVTWKSGERNNSASDFNLRTMNLDRQLEFQMIEGALWKHFEHCVSDERSDAKHAIAYSLATFFRQIGYGGAKNSNLLENCPTFMSKDKKALKNRMKKHFAHKGHQFSPRQFAAVTQCQLCQKVIWGLGHQAYHCSSCDLSIHRHCTEKIIDVCGRSRRSVRDMIPGRKPQNPVKEELQKNFFLPPFMSDPDDLRNLTTPVVRNGSEHERLQFPEFTTEFAGRSPNRSYSRQVCGSDDSDLEVDSDLPQLTDFIPKEELRQMKEKEKKRQQIINELFHTERLHSRSLKVMDKVFFRPMQDESFIDQEFVALLFPNLQDLIQLHDSLKKEFVALRKEKAVVDEVGLLLINRFSGSQGKKFKEACATFCADQAYALNVLRTKHKKDPRYSAFLQEAAANTLCKRQELKDFLPREMQRLSKYPLLIDSLRKNTSTTTEEHVRLTQALELSKSLLEHVNQAAKSVQNQRHLTDMQNRLDWRSGDTSSLGKYKFLNLTKHTLVYDGEVTWRPYRSRPIELHMVLFEDILVLLQKQDDRLLLRGHVTTVEDTKFPYCPVLKLNSLMIKDCATDKCAFFVVDSSVCPQVYELLAHSKEEKSKWFHYIQDTIKSYLGINGPYKGGRARSATQMIDLVSFKSDRGPTMAGDGEFPSKQTSDARSASCHVLTTYDDSPDNSTTTTGNNMQQVVSRLTTEGSFGAAKLSNVEECDNDVKYENRDDCGNIVDAPWSEAARFELARRLDELILCINQMMREKLKLASEDQNSSFGDNDDGSIQGSDVHALDAKELVTTALAYVKNLMDLINDQRGDVASSPDSSSGGAEERRVAIPAEDLLNISATLQRLTAQLAMRVTTDVAELERLEEDFRIALDDLKEKSSAIQPVPPGDRRPDDFASTSGATADVGASGSSENAFFPAASQANIYTVFNEDQLTYYDYHDQNDNANSDFPTEESKSTALVDED